MSVGLPGKKYGLKLNPNAVAAAAVARKHDALVGRKRPASQMSSGLAIKNVFACSDDDEDQGDDGPKTQEEVNRMLATGGSYADLRRRRQKRDIEQVLLQDETAFEFDSVYHELQAERATQAAAHQQQKRERKARYVQDLLKHAEAREREHAIILERRLLRERAAEDHLFGDKERFVTSAYKQKLLEEELWKREQQEKDARDEANSAERLGQRGIGSFHRNLMMAGAASRSSLVDGDREEAEARRNELELQAKRERKRFMQERLGGGSNSAAKPTPKTPTTSNLLPTGRDTAAAASIPELPAHSELSAHKDAKTDPVPEAAATPTVSKETAAAPLEPTFEEIHQAKLQRARRAEAARERYLTRKQQLLRQRESEQQ